MTSLPVVCRMPSFTRKNDFVCWVFLSEHQQKIYQDFASSEAVREVCTTPCVGTTHSGRAMPKHVFVLTHAQRDRLHMCFFSRAAAGLEALSAGGADAAQEDLRSPAVAHQQAVPRPQPRRRQGVRAHVTWSQSSHVTKAFFSDTG